MTPEEITSILRHTLLVALEVAAPFLLIALVVGLLISIFQSLTQMNEMTLSFVPKMLLIGVALTILFPWILKIMTKFTTQLLTYQWEKILSPTHYAL